MTILQLAVGFFGGLILTLPPFLYWWVAKKKCKIPNKEDLKEFWEREKENLNMKKLFQKLKPEN